MGADGPRLTQQSLRVLKLFSDEPGRRFAGANIINETGYASGTIYPILIRFETFGLLESEWEQQAAAALGRPRRRLYSITANGRALAHEALSDFQPTFVLRPAFNGVQS